MFARICTITRERERENHFVCKDPYYNKRERERITLFARICTITRERENHFVCKDLYYSERERITLFARRCTITRERESLCLQGSVL